MDGRIPWIRITLSLIGILTSISALEQSSTSYTVYHRLAPLHLTSDDQRSLKFTWNRRATIELDFISTSDTTFEDRQITVSSFKPDKSTSSLTLPTSHTNHTLYYQLSLVPSHTQPPPEEIGPLASYAISSSPLCALDGNGLPNQQPVQEYYNLWIRPRSSKAEKEKRPTTFMTEDYDLMGLNWATTRACSSSSEILEPEHLRARVERSLANINQWKSRLSVRQPESLPRPVLRPYPTGAPPEIRPDGSVKPPPPEKGWIAKYWMYLLPIVVLMLVGGGAPEEEQQQAAKS